MLKVGRQSIRVNLSLIRQFDSELLAKVPDYGGLLRIIAWVQLIASGGWIEPSHAIIDTGAHTSLLPRSLWQELDAKVVSDYYVRGLVPKEDCKIDIKIGWVNGKVTDKSGNTTPERKFRAYLALVDNIPFILGFKDFLATFKLVITPMDEIAYLEFYNPRYQQTRDLLEYPD